MSHYRFPYIQALSLLCVFHSIMPCSDDPLPQLTETASMKMLDTNSLTVNDIIIFESDIQMCMKILKKQSEDLKKSLKDFREEAIESLIVQALQIDFQRKKIWENYKKAKEQGQFAFEKEQEAQEFEQIFSRSRDMNQIAYYLLFKMRTDLGEVEKNNIKENFIHECEQTASNQGYSTPLYCSYSAREHVTNSFKENLAAQCRNDILILPSQIEKEITDIIKELLTTGSFSIQVFEKTVPKNFSIQQGRDLKNELADKLKRIKNNVEDFRDFILEEGNVQAYIIPSEYNLPKLNWGQLPALLQKEIATFDGGQIFGPIREGQSIKIYRIHSIEIPNCTQKVNKYFIRKIFNKSNPNENNAMLRLRMNRWARDILNNKKTFAQIAKEFSQDLISAENGGLLEDRSLEEITEDPKLQQAIEQLSVHEPLSRPIRGEDGWYLFYLENVYEESVDAREMISLKSRARSQLVAKATEEYLEKNLQTLKKSAVIRRYDQEKSEVLSV